MQGVWFCNQGNPEKGWKGFCRERNPGMGFTESLSGLNFFGFNNRVRIFLFAISFAG